MLGSASDANMPVINKLLIPLTERVTLGGQSTVGNAIAAKPHDGYSPEFSLLVQDSVVRMSQRFLSQRGFGGTAGA
jgi:hypothetical protein